MARVQVNIRFFYEDTIYADKVGFIPRHEALGIPELKVEENARNVQKVQDGSQIGKESRRDDDFDD